MSSSVVVEWVEDVGRKVKVRFSFLQPPLIVSNLHEIVLLLLFWERIRRFLLMTTLLELFLEKLVQPLQDLWWFCKINLFFGSFLLAKISVILSSSSSPLFMNLRALSLLEQKK